MGQTKGFASKVAVVKGVTWGTAALAGANHQVEFLNEGIAADAELIENDMLSGSVQRPPGDKGNEFHGGDLVVQGKYETLGLLWGLAFGTVVAPVQQGADIAYLHACRINNDLGGLFGTLAINFQEEIHEYPSFKVNGFRVECNSKDQVVKITFRLIADALNRNTGSGTNTLATSATWTLQGARARLFFKDSVFRMNDQSAGALGSPERQFLTGWALEVNRNLKTDDITTERGYLISEAFQDGHTDMMLEMTFSKFATDNVARLGDQLAKTRKKADLTITNGVANGATNYKQTFYFNEIQFGEGKPQIGGPGLTPWTLRATCHQASASPTGFPSGYTDGIQTEIINTRATGFLS